MSKNRSLKGYIDSIVDEDGLKSDVLVKISPESLKLAFAYIVASGLVIIMFAHGAKEFLKKK